jgi:heme-degrading monooxygenase HmoA
MINRVWHGWTTRENADGYQKLLRETVLPGIRSVHGFQGAQVLRKDMSHGQKQRDAKNGGEVEFIVITQFDSIDAVKQFAGEDYEVAVILPEAHKLLSRFDARAAHYETVVRIE